MKKLLVANRGEIAVRVMRTARAIGIATVAVYSDADAGAPHVAAADEAVRIGPAPATESYLRADRIIEAARSTGADAVHPGYGFLSENADFARALDHAGIVFVGPPAAAMDAMGLKDAAKALMERAGVPVTPGYQGSDQSDARFAAAAETVGFPLLIKAVAGGGGKGMRRADSMAELPDALAAARREGLASFGNGDLLIERLIGRPRHVEVQVFGDSHGNVVHLFERDCSLQRRHQKVIEEARAPGLSDGTRTALGAAAVKAATAIDYVGAGTIEFILDTEQTDESGDNPFYFMEMNTRLQVEHPVTELITGTDLVAWQIRVARGEALPCTQAELAVRGHAVEARLYAEDPDSGFLPSIGPLDRLRFPSETDGVRIDSGVAEGGEVSIHYDPMIAKVIAWAPDRTSAIDRLIGALARVEVKGVKTNRAFLARLANTPEFRSGAVHTGLIADRLEELTSTPEPSCSVLALAAFAATAAPTPTPTPTTLFAALGGWRMNRPLRRYTTLYPAGRDPVRLEIVGDHGPLTVEGLGDPLRLTADLGEDGTLSATLDGEAVTAHVVRHVGMVEVRMGAESWQLPLRVTAASDTAASDGTVTATMPGKVIALLVAEGQQVAPGERLLILEAMKMENPLTAPFAGKVGTIAISEGEQVAEGALLMEIVPEESD